uniref:Putative secreted protein n=1 Tax=Anopheles marajoara TaxID=58244 RepID=A0A2M4CG69_9DIPT
MYVASISVIQSVFSFPMSVLWVAVQAAHTIPDDRRPALAATAKFSVDPAPLSSNDVRLAATVVKLIEP